MIIKMDTFEFKIFYLIMKIWSQVSHLCPFITILNNHNKNQRTNAHLRSGICDLS